MPNTAPKALVQTRLNGIWQVLSDELRSYPGRTETVARMVVACTVTTLIVMTFRLPYAFLGIFNAFVISRQKPDWLVQNGFAAVAATAAAVVYTAVGVQLFYDYEVLHFVFLVFTLYLVFYLKRALSNDSVTFGFGVTATVALTLIWDLPHPTEAHLTSTISLSFVVMLGTLVAMAIACWCGNADISGSHGRAAGCYRAPVWTSQSCVFLRYEEFGWRPLRHRWSPDC